MLTLTRINERPPYGKHVVDMSVVCSFMGTVNDQSFLRDATGSRRFLVCRFDPVDCSKTIEFLRGVDFDPDMLWGEVYSELLDENCRAPFLEVLDSQEAEVRAGEVRQISDLESLLEDLIEVQMPRSQYDVRWLLPRKDLRVALEESGMTLGKNVVQKAAEWIATVTKAKSITDCMTVSQGERVFKGVRLRNRIVVPPTMPKKT
jgi:predicted P-loop ATPase